MSDSLADRLKKLSQQQREEKQAEFDVEERQKRINNFVAEKSGAEYERLLTLIQARIEEVNPQIGALPQFRVLRQGEFEQGNACAYLYFDNPFLNMPNNRLLMSFGPHRNAIYVFDDPPETERYEMQAAVSDSFDKIVWTGDLGDLTSENLADFVLEGLTRYYLSIQRR